jgi:hypothetical protein
MHQANQIPLSLAYKPRAPRHIQNGAPRDTIMQGRTHGGDLSCRTVEVVKVGMNGPLSRACDLWWLRSWPPVAAIS